MKTLIAMLGLSMGLPAAWAAPPSSPGSVTDRSVQVSIPAQPMPQALDEFARQTGMQVVFATEDVAGGITAPKVIGTYRPAEALERLLADSGLEFEFINARTVAVRGKAKSDGKVTDALMQRDEANGLMRLAQVEQSGSIATSAGDAPAQPGEEVLEEVMVTAQKRTQRRIDVPLSVSTLSGEALERAGIDTLLDLAHAVPGLVVSDAGGGFMRYYVRGIGNAYGTSSTSLVGVYLDEADVTGTSTSQLDLRTQDVERVEVLKGPQGTLYGAGSSGGTVRFITRDPQLDRFTASGDMDFYVTRNGDSSRAASAVLNVPVVEDVFGVRLVANYGDLGGWVDQPAAGRSNVNDQELREMRVKGLWKPTEALSLKGMVYLHREEGDGVASSTDENYVLEAGVDPTRTQPFWRDFDIYNLTASYDFPSVTLLSSSTYVLSQAQPTITQKYATSPPPDPIFEVFAQWNTLESEIFTQELRLSSPTAVTSRFNWTVGAFYKHVNYENDFTIDVGTSGVLFATIPIFSTEHSKSGSVFGDLSYRLTDRAEIGAGVRYFKDDLSSFDGAETRNGKFHSVDPRVYFSYGISHDVRLYASAADGFRSGGFNVENGLISTFDPEKVRSYELGLKAALPSRKLNFEAALFRSEYQDIQVFRLSGNNVGTVDNGGDARVRGIDLGLEWQATARFLLGLSGNITDSDYTSLLPGVVAVIKGDPVDFSTDYAVSVSGTYAFDWSSGVPGFVRLDYSRLGPSNVTDRSIPVPILFRSGVNDLLNARIGARWNRWSLELYGANLTNENRLQDPNGGFGFGARPRPRTIGIQLGGHFD